MRNACATLLGLSIFAAGTGLALVGGTLLFLGIGWGFRTDISGSVGMLASASLGTLAAHRVARTRWPAWVVGLIAFGVTIPIIILLLAFPNLFE